MREHERPSRCSTKPTSRAVESERKEERGEDDSLLGALFRGRGLSPFGVFSHLSKVDGSRTAGCSAPPFGLDFSSLRLLSALGLT